MKCHNVTEILKEMSSALLDYSFQCLFLHSAYRDIYRHKTDYQNEYVLKWGPQLNDVE